MGLTHEGESKSGRFWPVPKDGVSSIGQLRNGIPDNYGWLVPGRNLPLDPLNNPPPHSTSVFTGVLLFRSSPSHPHNLPERGHLDFVRQWQFSQHRQGGNELTVVAGLGRLWSWCRASVAHSRRGIVRNCRSCSAFKLRRAASQAECRGFDPLHPL